VTAAVSPAEPAVDEVRTALFDQPPRRGTASALAASRTFAWRSLVRIKRVPDSVATAVMQPIIFTVLFTYLFGGAISGSTGEYLQFFMPGVLVLGIVITTMDAGIGLNMDFDRGTYDRIRSLPVWRPAAIAGRMAGDAVRYAFATVAPLLLGLALGFRPDGGFGGVLLALLYLQLLAFSVAWIWTLVGAIVRSHVAAQTMIVMLNTMVVFTSNVVAPSESMPGWLQAVISANPVTHATTMVRGLMHGTLTGEQATAGILACAVLIALFAPATVYFYYRRGRR
jgi:ABC-2 type transport system permease protein